MSCIESQWRCARRCCWSDECRESCSCSLGALVSVPGLEPHGLVDGRQSLRCSPLPSVQGATCYMNSLLQQLYHVPAFSLQLLGLVPDSSRAGGGGGDGGSESAPREEDEVLRQLQVRNYSPLPVRWKDRFRRVPCKAAESTKRSGRPEGRDGLCASGASEWRCLLGMCGSGGRAPGAWGESAKSHEGRRSCAVVPGG